MEAGSQYQNRSHYNELYDKLGIDEHLKFLTNRDYFFKEYVSNHISWYGFYWNNFHQILAGKTVLELGAGDAMNAAVMASFGARVLANDISIKTGEIIQRLNKAYSFEHPIVFVGDNFLEVDLAEHSIDLVVGKAFVHHLDHELEKGFFKKILKLLKPNGEVRFFEPAVNSKFLDELRWATPVPGRPSKWLQPKAFKAWEASDPHPQRDNSSAHYKKLGHAYFKEVEVIPLGVFDRFYRVLPIRGATKQRFRRQMLKLEPNLPVWLRSKGARSQVINYKYPLKNI